MCRMLFLSRSNPIVNLVLLQRPPRLVRRKGPLRGAEAGGGGQDACGTTAISELKFKQTSLLRIVRRRFHGEIVSGDNHTEQTGKSWQNQRHNSERTIKKRGLNKNRPKTPAPIHQQPLHTRTISQPSASIHYVSFSAFKETQHGELTVFLYFLLPVPC